MKLYVLFEHASGYSLYVVREFEEIGAFLPQVEESITDPGKFMQIVKLVGFKAFASAASALENINSITEGILTDALSAFLETNLPKAKTFQLGVIDPKLGAAINEALGFSVTHIGVVPEVIRGIRTHLTHFVKGLSIASVKQTELGLGHSYSRGKVKFNVNRADNMIIQSIALVDQLDKDINTFAMRIKEWYSYHFPELAKIVTDNYQYGQCANFIKERTSLKEDSLEKLEEIVMDSAKAQAILDAARMSMGMDISPIDLINIERFAKRVVALSEYRKQLAEYLRSKMDSVAPNLATLIGEVVGARLISHAGSLTNLAKYPASTVQILGAEKALFRAIKTRSNTPKYGLIYHSTFIGRAGMANKGRISRYLANKCSIASRIDCFTENLTKVFGEKLRNQVEDRLKFYETGNIPRKNVEVMSEALEEHNQLVSSMAQKGKKRKLEDVNGDVAENIVNGETPKKKKKKKKKQQEEAATEEAATEEAPAAEEVVEPVAEEVTEKKKKKKNKVVVQEEVAAPEEPMHIAENGISEKKKKKKKKNQAAVVEAEQETAVVEEEVPAAEVTTKKKKKKKAVKEAVDE
ncbi:nucleolar protein 56 [Penaeus vannamei]|uniref:nucleolar protein 56 n=1 Tax=Penaeus vannamei TaxID=6689 RepID=UPI00387F777C